MKTICGFVGWIVGMLLGFMVLNSVPILGFALIIGGLFLGRYIGGLIEQENELYANVADQYKSDFHSR